MPLQAAKVEDVRDALLTQTAGFAPVTIEGIVRRIKSLLAFGKRIGYLDTDTGAAIKVQSRSPSIAPKLMDSEVEALVVAARGLRNRVIVQVAQGGLRVPELVNLSWRHVTLCADGRVKLEVAAKSQLRYVLLPGPVGTELLKLRRPRSRDSDPVFARSTGCAVTGPHVNRTPHLFASTFFRKPLKFFFRGSFDCKIVDVRSRV